MFRTWGELVVRYPGPVLAVVLVATGALAWQTRGLRTDIRDADGLPQEHPYVQLYNRINDAFGGGATVVVGIVVKDGDIFSQDVLARIQRITRRIEELPETDAGTVLSIASERVKAMRGTKDGLDVRTLMNEVPANEEGMTSLRTELYRDSLYVGSLVSSDATAAAVIADVSVHSSYPALHAKLEEIIAPERDDRTDVVLGGGPVILSHMNRYTQQMAILFGIAVVVIGLVHYEAFRTLQAMVLPLVTSLLSVVWALGIMGIFGAPIDSWSAITPVAILAVAAGHAVQILKRYYEDYARLGDNRAAVVSALAGVGPTMMTAGLVAAAGFASLATFGVTSVRVFGMMMGSGIVSALIIEMTFIPACRATLPAPRGREVYREREARYLTSAVGWVSTQVTTKPWTIVGVAVLVTGSACLGIRALKVDSSLRGFFSPSSRVRIDDAVINDKFAGASVMKILLEGKEDGALTNPEVLRAVEELQAFLGRFPEVGKTISLADYVKRMNRAMSGDDPHSAIIPSNGALISQFLFLYSPNDLGELVDASLRQGVIVALTKTDNAAFAHTLIGETREFVSRRFDGLPLSVGIAGGSLGAQAAMNEVIVNEKIRNILQVGVIILVLSSAAFRSWTAGLLVLAPLGVSVVITLGVMGWTQTPLSMSTATITAMAVSIGADFAIYLLFRLREELLGRTLPDAMTKTISTSGKAIIFVSSAVTLGYFVLTTSAFAAWVQLGAITGLMMAVSSVAAITLLPALTMLLRPRFLWNSAAYQQDRVFEPIDHDRPNASRPNERP